MTVLLPLFESSEPYTETDFDVCPQITRSPILGRTKISKDKYTIFLEGKEIVGTISQIKRKLIAIGTEKALKSASTLHSPTLQLNLGRKIIRGTVAALNRLVQDLEYSGKAEPPLETDLLYAQDLHISECPFCKQQMRPEVLDEACAPLLRGRVQRAKRVWYAPWRIQKYCAVICPQCTEIVDWEKPDITCRESGGPYR